MHIISWNLIWMTKAMKLFIHLLSLSHLVRKLNIQIAVLQNCGTILTSNDDILLNTLICINNTRHSHSLISLWLLIWLIRSLIILNILLRVEIILNMGTVIDIYKFISLILSSHFINVGSLRLIKFLIIVLHLFLASFIIFLP